jgi:hypothetical protein
MTTFKPTKATGSHFYKYQSAAHLEWLKPIILEHTLYVPLAAQLNDPFDCRPKIKIMSADEMVLFLKSEYIRQHPVLALDLLEQHEVKVRKQIETLGLDWFQRELTTILNSYTAQFRVYSLTKRFDNLSLWAKYAADHTGYCLEFENTGPLFGEHVNEVVYGEYLPFDVNDSANRTAGFLVSKRKEWSNEEEVRLIRARGSAEFVCIQPEWLTRIILGKEMTVEIRNQIQTWAKQRQPELRVVCVYFDEVLQEIKIKD